MNAPNITAEELRRIADSGDYGRGDFLRRAADEIDRLNAAARDGVVVSRDTAKLALTCIQRTHTFSVEFRRQHDEAAAELKDALEPTP
jgi:hypothetical protein